jgi:polyisoprenoid-binding protein YceI
MKKVILVIVMVLGLTSSVSASSKSGCVLAQKGKITVAWTAYKTASKIGVSGTFDKVDYKAVAKDGKNFREILVGSSVNIDTSSVNSKNTGRDIKLVKFFFKQMDSNTMNAKITDIKADKKLKDKARTGVVTLDVTMNGITKSVPMKYSFANGIFSAKGTIDIFDFSASKALSSINKACFDLHKGKTWNDVSIAFSTNIEASLCNVKPLK